MWEDPLVKETRAAREKQGEHSGRVVTLEPRRPEASEAPKK